MAAHSFDARIAGSARRDQVRTILLDDHHRVLRANVFGSPIMGAVLGLISLGLRRPIRLAAGVGVLVLMTMLALVLLRGVQTASPDYRTNRYALSNFVGGVAWGAYFWILLPAEPTAQLYLAVLIGLVMAANVVEASPVFRSFLAYHVTFSVIVISAFIISGHPDSRGIWLLVAPSAVYLAVLAKLTNKQANQRAELMVQNNELIANLNAMNEDLERRTAEDGLTGLANRLGIERFMANALEHRTVHGTEVAVLYVDLDRFKQVNDQCGHAVGDELLIQVARRLAAAAAGAGCVSRYGGDEFVVAMRCEDPAQAEAVAERIVDAVAKPFPLHGHVVHIGASVGVAVSSPELVRERALLRQADRALYRAKTDGGGHWRSDRDSGTVKPARQPDWSIVYSSSNSGSGEGATPAPVGTSTTPAPGPPTIATSGHGSAANHR